ncbi:hypothetical protein ABI59_15570 [Acidobacteria bacterium Mor1]|nr:hypothetical protein ABI59_15570 [Acidobacteria bacterium Mor1]
MRRISITVATILALFCVACAPDSSERDSEPASKPATDKEGLEALSLQLRRLVGESVIPGAAVAIVDADGEIYRDGFGFADTEARRPFTPGTVHIIASISKTFIGVALMKLVDEGKLSLDEPVNSILPFAVDHPRYPQVPITVEHLVTHTATLIDDFDPEDVGQADIRLLEELEYADPATAALMDEDLAYYRLGRPMTLEQSLRNFLSTDGAWYTESNFQPWRPGTRYEYSNLGSELAALIVEIRSGLPFDAYTRQQIFEPLGMEHTTWRYDEVDPAAASRLYRPDDWETPRNAIEHPRYQYTGYPSGDLKSTIDDLSRYLREMIRGSRGDGTILSPEAYDTLFAPRLDPTYFPEGRDDSPLGDSYDVGIFWAVSPQGYRLHNGGSIGVYSFLYFDPATSSGAVGFCNLPDGSFGAIRDAVHARERELSARKP